MPLVSIITPFHLDIIEKVSWFSEMLETIENQSLSDFEVVLIDDNSPLDYSDIREKYYNDSRFRWVKGAGHQGPVLLRNTGVALAKSDALLPIDSDDLLIDENVLQNMYNQWLIDPTKIIYGDINIYEDRGDGFQETRFFKMPEYTFEHTLDLRGIMPITCMHSKECHYKAGGWKPELVDGFEDIEYWISAGKAGFCGTHVAYPIFRYRKHNFSRSFNLTRKLKRENIMRNMIRTIHADVFSGRYPMGCCGSGGGGKATATTTLGALGASQVQRSVKMEDYPESEKIWVQYMGKRGASFGIRGPNTNHSYQIPGPSAKVQVHLNDLSKFKRLGRGQDFQIGVRPPDEYLENQPEAIDPETYEGPEPVMAVILELDSIATDSGIDAVESKPNGKAQGLSELTLLDLGDIGIMLEKEEWTIESLAAADTKDLISYKGIGQVRAKLIIEKAQKQLE